MPTFNFVIIAKNNSDFFRYNCEYTLQNNIKQQFKRDKTIKITQTRAAHLA